MLDRNTSTLTDAYRAGWSRVALGLSGLTFAQLFLPELAKYSLVFVLYILNALFFQVLIKKGIGGERRAMISGFVDLAMVTFLVHEVGSMSTLLVALYAFLGIMLSLTHQPRAAITTAVASVVVYSSVVVCEALDILAYAPAGPTWIQQSRPDTRGVIMGIFLVATMTLMSTRAVSQLVIALDRREDELRELNARLEDLSQRDPLTQLYNRRYLLERIEHELRRVRRGHPAALLMLDLDRFKRVNDLHGHLRGDELLQAIADAIARGTRAIDVVARYGGDEFAVLLSDASVEQAGVAAGRLVNWVRQQGQILDSEQPVTASVGVAIADATDDPSSLLRRADKNAYLAKKNGGDRVGN